MTPTVSISSAAETFLAVSPRRCGLLQFFVGLGRRVQRQHCLVRRRRERAQVSRRAKDLPRRNGDSRRGRLPGNAMKAFARLVGPLPGQDHPIELHNLLLEAEQLSAERGKARGQPLAPVCRSGRQQHAAVP